MPIAIPGSFRNSEPLKRDANILIPKPRNILFRLVSAMGAQRNREAGRIVDFYRQDRWSDSLEHNVNNARFGDRSR